MFGSVFLTKIPINTYKKFVVRKIIGEFLSKSMLTFYLKTHLFPFAFSTEVAHFLSEKMSIPVPNARSFGAHIYFYQNSISSSSKFLEKYFL